MSVFSFLLSLFCFILLCFVLRICGCFFLGVFSVFFGFVCFVLFCLRCLFRFRGVVRYALGVEQVLDLAAQCLCHPPKLVHVRAFTLPAAPAFHCAIAHASPAAKLPAAYPCGLAALVYGVIGVCFSHAAVLLLH
ncbi:MAG: hypothetical protein UDP17_10475, partial [Treponema sp.]|nr:hypothetical protein [Treponema sp.]